MRCTERSEMPVAAAIDRPVQCIASPGGLGERQPHHPVDQGGRQWRQFGLSRLVAQQTRHALVHETLLPAPRAELRNARRGA
jgi:hypothetical protein